MGHDGVMSGCEAPKLAEDSWMSGNPTSHHRVPFFQDPRFNENRTEFPLYGKLYPKYNLCKVMATGPNFIQ